MAEILEKSVTYQNNMALSVPTTTETSVLVSPKVPVPVQTGLIHIRAWVQWTTGTGTTAATVRIREGSGLSGTLVNQQVQQSIGAAAGGIEGFVTEATVAVQNVDTVQYTLSIAQSGATGNGTVQQAALEVEVLNG